MMDPERQPAASTTDQRPFQFSLRTLLLLTLFVSVSVDYWCNTDFGTHYWKPGTDQHLDFMLPLPFQILVSCIVGIVITAIVAGVIYVVGRTWPRLAKR